MPAPLGRWLAIRTEIDKSRNDGPGNTAPIALVALPLVVREVRGPPPNLQHPSFASCAGGLDTSPIWAREKKTMQSAMLHGSSGRFATNNLWNNDFVRLKVFRPLLQPTIAAQSANTQ